jgi:hypothetical protein
MSVHFGYQGCEGRQVELGIREREPEINLWEGGALALQCSKQPAKLALVSGTFMGTAVLLW